MSETFTVREQDSARPPSNISTREWGEQNRELSVLTSASAGRWSTTAVPFMSMVLEALDDEDVELIALLKSSQIAGTETFLTWLGKIADQDPGPAMMVFADEDTSKEIVERRLMPMFRTSRPLARLIEPAKFNKESITLLNNFSLTPAWASSIGKTASRPIRYLYCSEITKPGYGRMGAEGAVISRVRQRTETFPNKKEVFESSPTVEGDNMTTVMGLCEVVYDWHVPCPHCGAEQPLKFSPQEYRNSAGEMRTSGRVVFDDPEPGIDKAIAARLAGETARYECGECKASWTTAEKNVAVSRGRKVARTPIDKKPKRVGFCLSRLYSLFPGGRLESLAEAFLLAKDDPSELQVFVNNALGEHWKRKKAIAKEEELLPAKCEYGPGAIPAEAVGLTVAVDMQDVGFWYSVRAWIPMKTSWMIEYETLDDWEDVEDLLFERSWKKINGQPIQIWRAGFDIGGTKTKGALISRTEELYAWYAENRRRGPKIYLMKGASRDMPVKLKIGRPLEKTPSGKDIKAFSMKIIELNTDALKEEFFFRLGRAVRREVGAAYLHSQTGQDYFKQILSEEQSENGDWELVHGRDNHLLDTEMMHCGLINELLNGGIAKFKLVEPEPSAPDTVQAADTQSSGINPFTGRPDNENPFARRR